jgi:DNA-binding MarR family transcriptional regulator
MLYSRIIIVHNDITEKRMARPRATSATPNSPDPSAWPAFLLSQVGAHSAGRFADRLAPLGLKPPHAGILRALDRADGLSQQALGEALGTFPSRLVALLDELEERGLVERRDRPGDRRSYALHLTDAGREALQQLVRVARQHQDDLCAALDESEREQLAGYLRRIAEQQRLAPGIHPGWKLLGEGRSGKS